MRGTARSLVVVVLAVIAAVRLGAMQALTTAVTSAATAWIVPVTGAPKALSRNGPQWERRGRASTSVSEAA